MKLSSRILGLAAGVASFVFAPSAWAIIDSNNNSLSDIWEKHYNGGSLFSPSNPHHAPTADPDGDGWNNAKEALAGTDPFSQALPLGCVRTEIVQHPDAEGLFILSWPSVEGKAYKLHVSSDLSAWAYCGDLIAGTGATIQLAVDAKCVDETVPHRLFWRIVIADDDEDGDTLTTWEELQLGYDPTNADTDFDGIPDNLDPTPLANNAEANPDGEGLAPGLETGLIGRWDFEVLQTISNPPSGYTPFRFADLSTGNRPATSFDVFVDPEGMVSKAASHNGSFSTIAPALLNNRTTYSVAFWAAIPPGSVTTTPQGLFSHHRYHPFISQQGQANWGMMNVELNGVYVQKAGTSIVLRAGSYSYSNYYMAGSNPVPLNPPYSSATGVQHVYDAEVIDNGEWHHFVMVRAGGKTTLYVDGARLGNPVTHTAANVTADSYAGVSVGRLYGPSPGLIPNQPANPTAIKGKIDRLRVWSRELTAADATALYRQDVDHDGLWDITEAPTSLWRDANSDGVRQISELYFPFTNPFRADPRGVDHDGDGIPSVARLDANGNPIEIDEQTLGTKPAKADSDGDLMPDGWEHANGLDPLDPSDAAGDPDNDGASNLEEYRNNTDPHNPDTDGDGKSDGLEIKGPDGNPDTDDGSDPTDPTDGGVRRPANQLVSFKLGVGDRSGSKSEDYVLNVFRLDPVTGAETRVFTLRSGGFGLYKEITKAFRKGDSYSFQLSWQGSNNNVKPAQGGNPAEGPDYDYHMVVEPQGSNPGTALLDSYDPRTQTFDPSTKLLDPQDVNPQDDDDDDVNDLPNTLGPLRVVFLTFDVTKVYSDQIAGNEANFLPTPYYRGAPNNPMLMATRTGQSAHLAIESKIPAPLAKFIYVGVRKVGSATIAGSAACVAAPGRASLNFTAENGIAKNEQFYEVVAGFDADASGSLSNGEVGIVFEKTPKTDSSGTPVTTGLTHLDKIIVVTQTDFVGGKSDAISNNVWGTDYAGDLISAFAHGNSTVDEATTTSPHPVISAQPGLSHPVGARWDAALTAETHRVSWYNGSEIVSDLKSSYALPQVLEDAITLNLTAIKAATPLGGAWGNSGTYSFNISRDLFLTEDEWVGFNELGYTFGKIDFVGNVTVSSRWVAGGKIEVGTVTYNCQLDDVYDFTFWGGDKARQASFIQAGHATLTGPPETESGKIFYTRAVFSGSKAINKVF